MNEEEDVSQGDDNVQTYARTLDLIYNEFQMASGKEMVGEL